MNTLRITIGRNDDNTLKVPEEFGKVSGYHGEITMDENGNLVFTDFSSNGTLVNGQKIHKASCQIYRGDEIFLAGVCSVKWETLNNLLPPPQQAGSRETILMNQNQQSGGRKTVLRDVDNGGGRPTQLKGYEGSSRPTQLKGYNDNTNSIHNPNDSYPNQQPTILQPQVITPKRTSSGGKNKKPSPIEISKATRKWNGGAFCLSFIWGCFHRIYWPLIVPAANLIVLLLPKKDFEILGFVITWIVHLAVLVVAVYLGINGSERAWKLKVYEDLDDFKEKERRWAIAGFIFTGFQIVSVATAIITMFLTD